MDPVLVMLVIAGFGAALLLAVLPRSKPGACRDCGVPVEGSDWYCADCYDARAW